MKSRTVLTKRTKDNVIRKTIKKKPTLKIKTNKLASILDEKKIQSPHEEAVPAVELIPVTDLMKRIEVLENHIIEAKKKKGTTAIAYPFAEVADMVDNVLLFHINDASIHLQLGVFIFKYFAQINESFIDVATKLVQNSIKINPNVSDSYYWEGRIFEFRDNNSEARASFEKAISVEPNSKSYTALGLILAKEQNFREAIKMLLKAIEINPQDIVAMVNLGSVYLGYQKIDMAFKWTKKALDIDPNSLDAYQQYAFLLSEDNQQQEALEYYEKALKVSPNNATIYEKMSDSYMALENKEKAEECISIALELEPHNIQILNKKGQFAMAQENNINKAIEYFQTAITINPKESMSYNNMGQAMVELDKLEQAKTYFAKAISLSPEAVDPRLNYSQILSQEGNLVDAVATLQRFKPKEPRDKELVEQILDALKDQLKEQKQQRWNDDE